MPFLQYLSTWILAYKMIYTLIPCKIFWNYLVGENFLCFAIFFILYKFIFKYSSIFLPILVLSYNFLYFMSQSFSVLFFFKFVFLNSLSHKIFCDFVNFVLDPHFCYIYFNFDLILLNANIKTVFYHRLFLISSFMQLICCIFLYQFYNWLMIFFLEWFFLTLSFLDVLVSTRTCYRLDGICVSF